MTTHPSILAWEIPWTEEPGEILLQRTQYRTCPVPWGSKQVRHNLATKKQQRFELALGLCYLGQSGFERRGLDENSFTRGSIQEGGSREAVKVERPDGRAVGQRKTNTAALGLQRKGDNGADDMKGCIRKHFRLLVSGRKRQAWERVKYDYIFLSLEKL